MVLDDPTSSLDVKVTDKIFKKMTQHPKFSKKTFLVATKKASVLDYFDKAIFMLDGKINYIASPLLLRKHPEFQKFMEEVEKKSESEKSLDQINEDFDKTETRPKQEEVIAMILIFFLKKLTQQTID